MKNIEETTHKQRTDEWFSNRVGRFTGSRINELLGAKGLGKKGENYAFDRAVDILFGDVEDHFVSFDMQRGIDLEPLAFKKFNEINEVNFISARECNFFKIGDNAGASPDGITSDNGVLEIKCPKASTFFRLIATNEVPKNYYNQMQMEMLASGTEKAYFFNYLVHEGKEFHHEIVVERDEEVINLIKERIAEAVVIRDEFVEVMKKNKQF